MAAGDTVKIGTNPVFVGDDRYAPGEVVPASRFKKSDLTWMLDEKAVTLHEAKPAKAQAPKESGAKAEAAKADTDAKEDSK